MEDATRLRAWRAWLRKVERVVPNALVRPLSRASALGTTEADRPTSDTRSTFSKSPVAGAWQLIFTIENFAPALQKAVVERRTPTGAWEELFGLFTIEFQAGAARPRAARAHRVSVPLDWNGAAADFPLLRLAVRGFGRLRFRDVALTNGVEGYRVRPGARGAFLGIPAPRRGYPDFNWKKNRGEYTIDLRHAERHRPAQIVRIARG